MAKGCKFHADPATTIQKLRDVLTDDYCKKRMNMSVVKGFSSMK